MKGGEMTFEDVRKQAGMFNELPLRKERRGPLVGEMAKAIQGASVAAGVEYNGTFREARLRLASEAFQRKVSTYNELSDAELVELHRWTTTKGLDLKAWLIRTYGQQTRMGL